MKLPLVQDGTSEAQSAVGQSPDIPGSIGRRLVGEKLLGWISPNIQFPDSEPVVDIFIDDKFIDVSAACLPREDLAQKYGFIPETGFEFSVPVAFHDGATHKVAVRVNGTDKYLKNSGQMLTFPLAKRAQANPAVLQGSVNEVNGSVISGWAWNPSEPDHPCQVELRRSDEIIAVASASGYRLDLEQNGIGNGHHAFSIEVPDFLNDGEIHRLTVTGKGGQIVLKRGQFELGPIIRWPEGTYSRDFDIEDNDRVVRLPLDEPMPLLKVRLGVATELECRIDDLLPATETLLLRLEPSPHFNEKFGKLNTHVYPAGLKTSNRHVFTYDQKSESWKISFRLVPQFDHLNNGILGEEVEVRLALLIKTVGTELVSPGRSLTLRLPVRVKDLAPVTFTILDAEVKSKNSNQLDMAVLSFGRSARQAHPLWASFPDYIPPVIFGYVDQDFQKDLACVSRYENFKEDWNRDKILNRKPELFLIQAGRLSDEKRYTPSDFPQLVSVINLCRLTRTQIVYIQDLESNGERQPLEWVRDFADIIVDLTPLGLDDVADDKVISLKPFVSPGRINPLAFPKSSASLADLAIGKREAKYVVDGFWDCIDARSGEAHIEIEELRKNLHIIESNYVFSRLRAADARELYWNIVGCIDHDKRPEIISRYDQLVLLSNSSVNHLTKYRTVVEALLLRCGLKIVSPNSKNHAYSAILKDIFSPPPTSKTSSLLDFMGATVATRLLVGNHNCVDAVNTLLERSNAALVRHNRLAMRPKISCILVSKRPHLVRSALESILRQKYDNIEIVVIIHGGTRDETMHESWNLDKRIKVIEYIPKHRTLGFCLNYAVDLATGTYIAKFDDDDIYSSCHVADFVTALQWQDIELFVKPLGYVFLNETGTLLSMPNALDNAYCVYDSANYNGFVGAGGTLIFARRLAIRVRFSEMRRGGLDSDFVARAVEHGASLVTGDANGFALCRYGESGAHTWLVDNQSLLRKGRIIADALSIEAATELIEGTTLSAG